MIIITTLLWLAGGWMNRWWMGGLSICTMIMSTAHIKTHFAVLSSNIGVSDWRLLRIETPLQCLAWGCGYRLYMCSERTALLARGLSGVSGLISKQTDLILMPCLQLLGPESLSSERSSCEPRNTTRSWYLVDHSPLHFSSIHPTAAVKIMILEHETTLCFILRKQR